MGHPTLIHDHLARWIRRALLRCSSATGRCQPGGLLNQLGIDRPRLRLRRVAVHIGGSGLPTNLLIIVLFLDDHFLATDSDRVQGWPSNRKVRVERPFRSWDAHD